MNTVKIRDIEIGTGAPKIIVPIVGVTKEDIIEPVRKRSIWLVWHPKYIWWFANLTCVHRRLCRSVCRSMRRLKFFSNTM